MGDDEHVLDILGSIRAVRGRWDDDESIPRIVDPTPLQQVLRAWLIGSDDLGDRMRTVADDDRDGPVHIMRLLDACDLTGRALAGVHRSEPGPSGGQPVAVSDIVIQVPELAEAWQAGGITAAVAAIRAMPSGKRHGLLELLMDLWSTPIIALCNDPT